MGNNISNNKPEDRKSFKDEHIDFGAIFAKYKRFWWLFAISFSVCITFAGLYLYVKNPLYIVNAKVLISQEDNNASMGGSLMKSLSLGMSGASVDDEIIVIGSQSIRQDMVKQLKLNRTYNSKSGLLKKIDYYNNSPIEINAPEILFDTLTSSLSFKIEVNENATDINVTVKKGIFKTIAEVNAAKFPVTVSTPYGIYSIDPTKHFKKGKAITIKATVTGNGPKAETYERDLTIGLVSKKSNGITINLDETNIERGKDILNKIVELYNIRGQVEKDEMAVNTGKFINERINIIYNDLANSEIEIEAYKRNNDFTDLGAETQFLMAKKGTIEGAIMRTETQHTIIVMIRDFLKNPKNKYSLVPFSSEVESASTVIEAYNGLVLQRLQLENDAKGNNIILRSLSEQIDALRENLIASIDKAVESTQITLKDLKDNDMVSRSKLGQIPTQEREFIELRRQQSIRSTLYSLLLQKREENELLIAATTPKGKIVDKAFAFAEPIEPKKPMVIILALFLGLCIPAMILYLKSLFTTRFSSQDELESLTNAPILGEICHSKSESTIVVTGGKTTPIVELFRLIRNNIQFMLTDVDKKVILVTSSISGEGKSFISTNIASSFALTGKRVVLIGLDIRSPKLSEYLPLASTPGITSYLSKMDITTNDIIQHYGNDGLDVIVSGPIPPNPSELLLSNRLGVLFEELRKKYDYIIIDSAPIALVSDTFSLAKYVDTTVYVTRANYTLKGHIKYLNSVLRNGHLSNVSLVLNDSNPKLSNGYGYGYGEKKTEESH